MHTTAQRALKRRDPVMGRLIDTHGACPLAPRRDYFVMLCKSIVSQQLSTKAAATIFGRFRDLFDRRRPTPAGVLALKFDVLRGVGLSNQKTGYVIDLAANGRAYRLWSFGPDGVDGTPDDIKLDPSSTP